MASVEQEKKVELRPEELVNSVVREDASLAVRRYLTIAGRDPLDEIEWEIRDAFIPGKDKPVFEQRGVEFPKFWSQTATNIVAQKYFRGRMSSPERERSVKQMIGRVVSTIGTWGRDGGYFATEDEAQTFEDELKAILVNQLAAFNSPVWFNVGFEERPQCSACMPYHQLVSTPDGMVPIGELVEGDQVGREVYDAHGVTRVMAVKHNGRKPVYRVTLRNGQWVEATPDHVVKAVRERRTAPEWLRVDELELGMRMHLYPHRAKVAARALVPAGMREAEPVDAEESMRVEVAEAALAGWLQADGFVGEYDYGTNRSLIVEFQVANDEELTWVMHNLDIALPEAHRHVRDVTRDDGSVSCRRVRLYGEVLREFVDAWDLLARGTELRVPKRIWTAPRDEIAAYLQSVFQADGYVTVRRENGYENARIGFAVIAERWSEDIQLLLNVLGIHSRRLRKAESRPDRHELHEVVIGIGSERARFAELVGFVGKDKQCKLLESLEVRNPKHCPDLREEEIVAIDVVGLQDVYDIQTESGEYLANNIAVHNCFILSIDDSMDSILDWIRREGIIFRGGSGSGVNLSRLRSSKEQLSKGGYASGPVSFMRGADASAGTIKSGGKTRRAAKMVVLDVDHPDIEEFIWCKAREEEKARVLEQAGFDMSLDSPDWASIQYQNANNSVRVSDAFMKAVENDDDWNLTARTDGSVVETKKARNLLHQMAEAAWRCADPGVQYDTTINSWHTLPNTGRINASNPCCFVGETLVDTEEGLLRFDELFERKVRGEGLPRIWSFVLANGEPRLRDVTDVWIAGAATRLVEVTTEAGHVLRCTPDHRFLTANGYVEAQQLGSGVELIASAERDAARSFGGAILCVERVAVKDVVRSVRTVELPEPIMVYDLEADEEHNFGVASHSDAAVVVHNSEYMSIDDSACNLASLNLMKFRREDGELDVEAFEHAVDVMFLAQEILVGYSSYPTPEIERNARGYRQLGLGYANLGALLMARGLPYDSDEGRAYAAAITALMTGRAYRKSAEIAGRMGPFAGYRPNAAAMIGVIAKHRAAVGNIAASHTVPNDLLSAARKAWDDALDLGEVNGYRNAQATVLAPTGCLVGDSLISTSRGLIRLRTLGNPVGSKWQDLAGVDVATDEGPRKASQFYVNGFEQVVSIETGRGYRIQGTPTHRIKVVDERGEWAWKRFAEVATGDRVPLMLNSIVGEPQEVILPPLGELYWTADWRTHAPRTMTPHLAELVGYFMGDGSLHAKGLRFCVSSEDQDVVEHLADLGASLFGIDPHVTAKTGYTELSFNSVPLVVWWEACGFAKHPPAADHAGKGWHAHVPNAVLHTNDRDIYAAFIRGLFEADGTTNNGYVSWTTISETFSRDVQTLLLALGFVTSRKVDAPDGNWGGNDRFVLQLLNVAASDRYLREIDFISTRKAASLLAGDHRQASGGDHIPVTRGLLDQLAPENANLRKTMLMALARRGDVSRRSATALLERTADSELEHLLGFYYDTVASVEILDDEPTYDISVPDNVTYVANGFVSHNTISFMMDCDTTGVEPDFSLVKSKKLVGGGEITIVNKTVPLGLEKLGYAPSEVDEIVAFVDERNTVVGAPYVKTEHYPIFDCAIGERAVHYTGHVKMMGAIQPAISGAISKTVNLPESVSVDDVAQVYLDAWKLGVKAIAIYRDNCKVAQPLSGKADKAQGTLAPGIPVTQPKRRRLPDDRTEIGRKFRVGEYEGYIHVGVFPEDGTPGDIFVDIAKDGTTLQGLMNSLMIAVSMGLQYGVPPEVYVSKLSHLRFEPSGPTNDPDIRTAKSIVDYIFRWFGKKFLDVEQQEEVGILSPEVRARMAAAYANGDTIIEPAPPEQPTPGQTALFNSFEDAIECNRCGGRMVRAGTCYTCRDCGTSTGCG